MHANPRLVVVSGKQVVAGAIGGEMHRVAIETNAVQLGQRAVAVVDAEAGESKLARTAPAHEDETFLRVHRHGGGHAGQGEFILLLQRAVLRVQRVMGDPVFLLEGYVHVGGHFGNSSPDCLPPIVPPSGRPAAVSRERQSAGGSASAPFDIVAGI